jgi:starch-binding outer membrane protein, SusD/RagB family
MNGDLTMKNRWKWIAAGVLALGLGCADIDIPNLNNLPYDGLRTRPTRTLIMNASTGLLIGTRAPIAQPNGYVAMLGILGRESYNFDRADPRFISEMLEATTLDPGSPAFGGNFWQQPYSNIRNATTLITALDAIDADPIRGVTDSEKAAIRGFARTVEAMDFLVIAVTRWSDTNCGPVVVDRAPTDPLAPIVGKDDVLAHISGLLDTARDELATAAGGGDVFPFELSSGFDGFDKPSTFTKVNRALAARVLVYRQQWSAAQTALGVSFIDPAKSMRLGAYHAYGNGSGDTQNGLTSPNEFAHPKLQPEAEAGDTRIFGPASKLVTLATATTLRDITSNQLFTLYPTGDTPVPIIRNEELILLRAEVATKLNDFPAARTDVNLIRTTYGLAAKMDADLDTETELIDEILKQRRYSLLFEGGHRWIDLRRHNKLDASLKDLPTHFVHQAYPIPVPEIDARSSP